MNKEKIYNLLAHTLKIAPFEISSLPLSTRLADIGLDSLKFITFIVALENELNIVINDNDLILKNFETIETLFATLSKYFSSVNPLKKCLVIDCDNSLWKGISGEEEIIIDNEVLEFHKLLLELYRKGVLLCLCSKNEPEHIWQSFSDSRMLIDDSIFVASRIGQLDKATYIMEIAEELNLSTDSFVFVDDSSYEVGLISHFLPEVTPIIADYSNLYFINEINILFQSVLPTGFNRNQQYKEQKAREKEKSRFLTVDEYNNSLETNVRCFIATLEESSRLSELSIRSNQFNLSNRHYSKEEVDRMIEHKDYSVYALSVKDKYGDMGIVGMGVFHSNTIEAFIISCRVFGRGFESVLLHKLTECSKDLCNLKGLYVSNEKNKKFSSFYESNNIKSYE